jgi:signal peptidase I
MHPDVGLRRNEKRFTFPFIFNVGRMAKRGRKKQKTTKNTTRAEKKSVLRTGARWLRELALYAAALLLIHLFLVQPFVVPTPSMAHTILPGDRILVSKLHYGPQTPRTLGIPFTDFYVKHLTLPNLRLPGFSEIHRGDVVVFHWPADDGPIDKRDPYVKRAIALPGDTLVMRDKAVYVNGEAQPLAEGIQHNWIVRLKPGAFLPPDKLTALGVGPVYPTQTPQIVLLTETAPEVVPHLSELPYVESIEPHILLPETAEETIFPQGSLFNRDQYGPLVVPGKGQTITLTEPNWTRYETIITRYENHTFQRLSPGRFAIDGAEASTYTFAQDYYFMMGDNRDNSLDSRYWGFVPADHIMGKALALFFSWDPDAHRPRWSRFFTLVE